MLSGTPPIMARKKKSNERKEKIPNLVRRKPIDTNETKAEETDPQQLPLADTPPRFERFMDLPPEHRLLVYEFTLTEAEQPVQVDRRWRRDLHALPHPPRLSGLMGTCNKVRKGVAEMYYCLNNFHFRSRERLYTWLKDRNRREQFCGITCHLDSNSKSYSIIELLGLCTALVRLQIRVDPHHIRTIIRQERFRPFHGFA